LVNKKLKEFKKLVKDGKLDLDLWMLHFGDKRPDKCKCKDCMDFKTEVCTGGKNPFNCMQESHKESEVVSFDSLNDTTIPQKEIIFSENKKDFMICRECGAFMVTFYESNTETETAVCPVCDFAVKRKVSD